VVGGGEEQESLFRIPEQTETMATFATDSSDAEKGPTRSDTFDTLVPEQDIPLQPLSPPPLALSSPTPESRDATTSPTCK
jgi:hypothetical protein